MKIGDENIRDIDMGFGLIKKGEMIVTNIKVVPSKYGFETTTTFTFKKHVDEVKG
jgi:hypothetical protein